MRRFKVILFLFVLLSVVSRGNAQGPAFSDPSPAYTDSILRLARLETNDSIKASLYLSVARNTYNTDSALKYSNIALQYCRATDTSLIAQISHVLGWRYYLKHEIYTSIQYLRKAYNWYDPERDYRGIGICCIVLSQCFETLHLPDSVFYYLNKSLDNSIMRNDTAQMAISYLNLGRISINLTLYDNADDYIGKAIVLDSLSGNTQDMACAYFWRGYLNIALKNYQVTGRYLRNTIRILENESNLSTFYAMMLHLAYSYMAETYIASAERTGVNRYADSCLTYTKKGSDFFLRYGQNSNYMISRYAYVKYLMYYKRYNEALDVLKEFEQYMTGPDLRREYHKYLTLVYEKLGNYKEALAQQKMHYECAMEYLNDSSLTALADSKTHQALLLKEAEQRQTDRIHHVETRRMQIVIISLAVVGTLLFLLMMFVYRMWKVKKVANNELSQKNRLLDQQKHEIQAQRDELEQVHNAVVSSVKYSERIQRAAIPHESEIKRLFPESFVYYRPRDIVSGDFYYAAQCGKYKVFVVSDCTGHGIPGGFLSMLGISSLKEFLVTEQDAAEPGKVLDNMRNFIKDTLVSTDDSGSLVYDGMEMVICSFDLENHRLVYASAYQSAYIIRDDNVIRLSCDKMPVGRYFNEKEHFTTREEILQPGDMVYLFSDGIQDQTNLSDPSHPLGKKFQVSNLLSVLKSVVHSSAAEQCIAVDNAVEQWRNGAEQVDDITLVGIRI